MEGRREGCERWVMWKSVVGVGSVYILLTNFDNLKCEKLSSCIVYSHCILQYSIFLIVL